MTDTPNSQSSATSTIAVATLAMFPRKLSATVISARLPVDFSLCISNICRSLAPRTG